MKKRKKDLKEQIINLIKVKPECSDDWMKTLAYIWRDELEEKGLSPTIRTFLSMVHHREITNPDDIRRKQQTILADDTYESLRGPGYNKRHKIIEPAYRKKIIEEKIAPPQQELL